MAADSLIKEKLESAMEEDPPDAGDEEDEDIEEVEEEEEEGEEEEDDSVTHGRRSGRGLTLMTLLKEKVLQPGLGNMTINYLGNKFKGDLLSDGRIRSQETGKVFGTPSAWAIYCKQIVNPNKKSGCGWASVKYRGKKLDEYKNNWNRQKRLEFEREGDEIDCGGEEEGGSCSESEGGDPFDHEILEFDMLSTRHDPPHAGNPLLELCSFPSLGRLQPFTVAASSSAMAVLDLHVHLTRGEATGFLAGQWDVNNHNLIVSHAFPLCCDCTAAVVDSTVTCGYNNNNNNSETGHAAEVAIHRQMAALKLALVGWYHSHPHSAPLPSLRDVDAQLDYEMKMKGTNDASYTPCVGLIAAPFNDMHGRPLNARVRSPSTASRTPPSASTTVSAVNGSQAAVAAVTGMTVSEASVPVPAVSPVQSTNTVSITPVLLAPYHSTKTTTVTATDAVIPPIGLTPMNCFWVMPPPEHRPHEYPRPMAIVYNVVQDAFVPREALLHMRECVKYYSKAEDAINLHDTFSPGITYWDKLRLSIKARVPKDHYFLLIEYLHKILRIKFPLTDLNNRPLSPPPVATARPPFDTDSAAAAALGSLVAKGREAGLEVSLRSRPRPYPDPTKLHPLLVDRSDERALQPLLLERAVSKPLSLLAEHSTDKAQVSHILREEPETARLQQQSAAKPGSPGVPLPATPHPPDYPFPLLRGMMAEQVSNVQKQQEQRYEDDMIVHKDKHRASTPQLKHNSSPPLMESELLMQINESFLQQQRLQAQDKPVFHGKQQSSLEGKASLYSISRPETSPPLYGRDGDRGSPPPYNKHDRAVFPAPLPGNALDAIKKTAEDASARATGRESSPAASASSSAITFSPVNLLKCSASSSETTSILSPNFAMTPTSGASLSSLGLPAGLSITSVSRDSSLNLGGQQTSTSTSALTISSQSSALSASPLSITGQHPPSLGSPFYPSPAPTVSPVPLSSSRAPALSPSPLSFQPPCPPSPGLGVEVSPRHTEWAQNALPGMTRPPVISVKSQAALSQPPYSPSACSGSTASTSNTSPAVVTTGSLASLVNSSGAASSSLSQAALAEALSAGAAEHWMTASFAGLSQFPGFNAGSQYGKPPPQYSEQQHYQQYRTSHSLHPSATTSSTTTASEQLLLQQQQEQRQ